MSDRWNEWAAGIGCPHDAPRPASNEYMDFVAKLSVSSLYLSKDQTYRGTCGLIFDPRHVTRIDELSAVEFSAFSQDLFRAHAAIVQVTRPDHMNVALLGNSVPHLHWGIVPRYRSDPRWGLPIWGSSRKEISEVRVSADEQQALIAELRRALAAAE